MAIFEKIVLCANTTHLMVGVWRFRQLKFFEIFSNDAQGHEAFRRFLHAKPNTTIHFLVDALEEDYRLESLPHTRGGDRKALVERKLNQIYRGQTFRAACFFKREKTQVKNDIFSFMALNNAEFLQAWLAIILELEAPLAGVYLLSMATALLVQSLKLNAPHIIFTEKLSTGLRQSYLQYGELRLSRLVPFSGADANPAPQFYVDETEKTRLYLNSQHYMNKDTPVTLAFVCLDSDQQSLCKLIEVAQAQPCLAVDLAPLVQSLKLYPALVAKTPELVQMDLLAKLGQGMNLAPPKFTKHYRMNRSREMLNLATMLVLLIGLIVSGFYFQQDMSQQSAQKVLIAQTKRQQQLYQQVAKDFPATPLPSHDLQLAVELKQAIKSYQRSPERMMQVISNAIAQAPEIQINRLFWVQTNDRNLKDKDVSPALAQTQENQTSPPLLSNTELYETAFVNGEIKHFSGDYRAALSSVHQLVGRLKIDSAVAYVEILQAPVNVSAYSNLAGSTSDEVEAKQASAIFKLKLIFKRDQT